MRDVLLAEVTLKIKKTWHIKWQLKSVKFGGYIIFPFFVQINFNCSTTVCVPLAPLETRHSECETVSQHWILFFCTGGQERPCSGLQAHSHSLCAAFLNVIAITVLRVPLRYVNTSLP